MNVFYEQELKILQNLKKEFDNSYSNAELNFNTEQVITGLASLTARIREEMAETENEIAKDFVESVAPELLLPLPARSLAEIIPSPADNLKREIPNGALLFSKYKNNKPFFWRIIGNHNFNPEQKIISIKAAQDSEGFDCLEIESNGSGPWVIFIDGESEFAWVLWYFMQEYSKPPSIIKPHIIAKSQNPWELCRDFFCFEEKFRYIYTDNLPNKIRFAKKIPSEIFSKICTKNFKLNVLPIENIFEQNLEPILLNSQVFEEKIFPNEKRQIILSLKEVLAGSVKTNFEKIKYRYNSGKIRFANLSANANTLSISAIVCDGIAATDALEQNSLLQAKNSTMQMCSIASAINALPFLPPIAKQSEWVILSLLQKNYLQFFEGDTLKNALEMQLWNIQGKRNYLANSIKNVFVENKSAVYKGCLVPLANVNIILSIDFFNKNNYEFLGILKAFGEMLFYLLKKIFICNILVKLILHVEPLGMELKWE